MDFLGNKLEIWQCAEIDNETKIEMFLLFVFLIKFADVHN